MWAFQKKLTVLADMSAKAFSPPQILTDIWAECKLFFVYTNISFLKEKFQKILNLFPNQKNLNFLSGQGFCPAPL